MSCKRNPTGESITAVPSSHFFQTLGKKDLEVLYMVDPTGEYAVQQLKAFDGKKLKPITKGGLDIEQPKVEQPKVEQPKVDPLTSTRCSS